MQRRVLLVVVLTVLAVLFSVLILAGWYALFHGSANPFGDALHRLVLFMDVGVLAWLLAIIIASVRARVTPGVVILAAIGGAILNFLVVLVVGLIQQGAFPATFLSWAAEAGFAFIVAVALAQPIARAIVRPQ